MTLSGLVNTDLIIIKSKCTSKNELILELLEQIYKFGLEPPFPMNEVLKKISIREEIGGTLFPVGLSIPHARLQNYESFVIALGVPSEPILHNGIYLKLMALMISSQSGGLYYLPTLAELTKLSRDSEFFPRLCSAENSEEFVRIIKERD